MWKLTPVMNRKERVLYRFQLPNLLGAWRSPWMHLQKFWYFCNSNINTKETLTLNLMLTLSRKKKKTERNTNHEINSNPNISPDLSRSTTLIPTLTLLLTLTCHPRGWGKCLGLSLLSPNLMLHWMFTEILWGTCKQISTKIPINLKSQGKNGLSSQNIKISCNRMDHCAMNPKQMLHLMKQTENKKLEI